MLCVISYWVFAGPNDLLIINIKEYDKNYGMSLSRLGYKDWLLSYSPIFPYIAFLFVHSDEREFSCVVLQKGGVERTEVVLQPVTESNWTP